MNRLRQTCQLEPRQVAQNQVKVLGRGRILSSHVPGNGLQRRDRLMPDRLEPADGLLDGLIRDLMDPFREAQGRNLCIRGRANPLDGLMHNGIEGLIRGFRKAAKGVIQRRSLLPDLTGDDAQLGFELRGLANGIRRMQAEAKETMETVRNATGLSYALDLFADEVDLFGEYEES